MRSLIETPEGEWIRRKQYVVKNLDELADLISKRDNISKREAEELIAICQLDMETAFYNGDLALAEDIMQSELSLEMDYFDLFIN